MHEQKIYEVAGLLGAEYKPRDSSGWVTIQCPFAKWRHESGRDRHPSMRILSRHHGISRWKCFSCSSGGDLAGVLFELKHLGADLPWKELNDIAIGEEDDLTFAVLEDSEGDAPFEVPKSWLDSFPMAHTREPARAYCAGRGVSLMQMMQWDLRFDMQDRRVCFPIRDGDGVLRGLQGRAIDATNPERWMHYKIASSPGGPKIARGSRYWLNEDKIDFDWPVVLVEGGFDGTSVDRVYRNVAVNMGAATVMSPLKLDRLASALMIVTMFDNNVAGTRARNEVTQWCKHKRVVRHCVPPEEFDPGSLSVDGIRTMLAEHIDIGLLKE